MTRRPEIIEQLRVERDSISQEFLAESHSQSQSRYQEVEEWAWSRLVHELRDLVRRYRAPVIGETIRLCEMHQTDEAFDLFVLFLDSPCARERLAKRRLENSWARGLEYLRSEMEKMVDEHLLKRELLPAGK